MIKFKNVSYQRKEKTILKNINWTVRPKEHWAMLGLNGSGKSTLLKMIVGDIWPTTGELTVLKEKFGQTSIPELRKRIGWVTPFLAAQFASSTLAEEIVLSGKFASIGIYQQYSVSEMDEAKQQLQQLGLQKVIGQSYLTLSQGEKQGVLIARALIAEPELLILDEPCTGLDLFAREKLLTIIDNLTTLSKAPTLLLVTHHTEEITPTFTNLLLLKDGEIFAQGHSYDLLSTSTLSKFYQKPVAIQEYQQNRILVVPSM